MDESTSCTILWVILLKFQLFHQKTPTFPSGGRPTGRSGKPDTLNNRTSLKRVCPIQRAYPFCLFSPMVFNSANEFLHDLTRDYESTIVDIVNGHVSGRKVGDSGTNLGLEVLRGTKIDGDRFNCISNTRDGKVLRSSSIYFLQLFGFRTQKFRRNKTDTGEISTLRLLY